MVVHILDGLLLFHDSHAFNLYFSIHTSFFFRSDPTENDSVEGLRPNARGPGLVTFGVGGLYFLSFPFPSIYCSNWVLSSSPNKIGGSIQDALYSLIRGKKKEQDSLYLKILLFI